MIFNGVGYIFDQFLLEKLDLKIYRELPTRDILVLCNNPYPEPGTIDAMYYDVFSNIDIDIDHPLIRYINNKLLNCFEAGVPLTDDRK